MIMTAAQLEALQQLTATADQPTLERLAILLGVDTGDGQPRWIATTQEQVASFFGVAKDTVRKDWTRSGMPGVRGCYDLAEIRRWKDAREKDPSQSRRLSQAAVDGERAKILALKRAEMEGRLLDRGEVGRCLATWNLHVRTNLVAIIESLTNLAPGELKATFKHAATGALRRLLKSCCEQWLESSAFESMDDAILEEGESIKRRRAAAVGDTNGHTEGPTYARD